MKEDRSPLLRAARALRAVANRIRARRIARDDQADAFAVEVVTTGVALVAALSFLFARPDEVRAALDEAARRLRDDDAPAGDADPPGG